MVGYERGDDEAAAGIEYFLKWVEANGAQEKFIRRSTYTNRWQIALPRKAWMEKHSRNWSLEEKSDAAPVANVPVSPAIVAAPIGGAGAADVQGAETAAGKSEPKKKLPRSGSGGHLDKGSPADAKKKKGPDTWSKLTELKTQWSED